jgi:hypothetical protein
VYHLRFDGELLTHLDVEHATLMLAPDPDRTATEHRDTATPVDNSKKPRPR